jgi:hypothetical protein
MSEARAARRFEITNPFTPSKIAASPAQFFGRDHELHTLSRAVKQGSVLIQGPVGIGKSSLMAQGRLAIEGFGTTDRCFSVLAVAHKDISTVDDAARAVLEKLVSIDEKRSSIKFKFGSLIEYENSEVQKFFGQGRHLAALSAVISSAAFNDLTKGQSFVICIDEADKSPKALARLMRILLTQSQHREGQDVTFLLAGVSPFLQTMIDEDPGIHRFVYKQLTLGPMSMEEAADLLGTKLRQVAEDAKKQGLTLNIDPAVIPRICSLAGGHPHILQLLGSHMVEHENDDPDEIIDARDLTHALTKICYEARGDAYRSTLHRLELHSKDECLLTLLGMTSRSPLGIITGGFPTRIDRSKATTCVPTSDLEWLEDNGILSRASDDHYGLVDEFLRLRIVFDQEENEEARMKREARLISRRVNEDYQYVGDDDDDD